MANYNVDIAVALKGAKKLTAFNKEVRTTELQVKGLNQSLSRRRGRTGSKSGGKSSGGGGGNGGGPGGGSPGGGGGINRSRKRRRCDVRCKIDISPLINSNLVKDDLAELAYFVQEIKK